MLPPSLVNFQDYQSRYLACLNLLPNFKELSGVIEEFLKKIVASGAMYIRIRPQTLPLIIKDGFLKNAVETATSASLGGAKSRMESTEFLFNCDKNKMSACDYPTFGYLSTDKSTVNLYATYEMAYQYGEIAIKLKKANLLQRTTMTVGTSLDFMSFAYLVPTLLSDPKATCIAGLSNMFQTGGQYAPYGLGSLDNYLYLAAKIKEGTINEKNFFRISELLGYDNPLFKYVELQFHGRVSISDFEEIDIMDPLDKRTSDQLNALKIPVVKAEL